MTKKRNKENFEKMITKAVEIAYTKSFGDALKYFSKKGYLGSKVFERLWEEVQEDIRLQMYKNQLEKPYIYWFDTFIEEERKRSYIKKWRRCNSADENSIAEFNAYNEISYYMYKYYSRREIVKRLSKMIYEATDVWYALETEVFLLLSCDLEYILHYPELVKVWKNAVNYYVSQFRNGDDVRYFAKAADHIRKGTVGEQVISEYVTKHPEIFLPYLDKIPKTTRIAKLLIQKNNEKND